MLPLHHGTDLESQRGLEPLSLPWRGSMLPLHYCDLVEAPGLEPGPDSLQESRSPFKLHPLGNLLEPGGGLEPPTFGLQNRCSDHLKLHRHWYGQRDLNPRLDLEGVTSCP